MMKQIGLLPTSLYCKANASETTLPVQGVRIADGLVTDVTKHVADVEPEADPVVKAASFKQKQLRPAEGIVPQGEDVAPPTPSRSAKTSGIIPVAEEVTHKTVTPVKKTAVSSIFSDEPEAVTLRPSTKVHQHPGGYSHNIFSAEPEPLKTSVPIDPRRFTSQISWSDDKSVQSTRPSSSRRDPNYSSLSELPEDSFKTSKKVWTGKSTESHFSIAPAAEEEVEQFHPSRRMSVHGNESHFSLTDAVDPRFAAPSAGVHRNPNEESMPANYVRPSSRVLGPPGGRSTFTLG